MSRRRKRVQAHPPGWSPSNAVAWCALHSRGMNAKYMRVKHCIRRGGTCPYLRWAFPEDHSEPERS